MQSDTYIPRRLDDQWKIGFWDADVAAPVLFFFFVGYASGTYSADIEFDADGFVLHYDGFLERIG